MKVGQRRVWVQRVVVELDQLETRLAMIRATGGLAPEQEAIAASIANHAQSARNAVYRQDPVPNRMSNWFRGTLVEAATRHLHAAIADLVDLYNEDEIRAELPFALARARLVLPASDARVVAAESLLDEPIELQRARLRRLVAATFSELDRQQGQVRAFGRILLLSAGVVAFLMTLTVQVVAANPDLLPLCFPREVIVQESPTPMTQQEGFNCPTGSNTEGPTPWDVGMVTLLGALGGVLSAIATIRTLGRTAGPYDVPLALAALKVPVGAFTALLGIVLIRGGVVPGLSILDSQGQILAYALVFGFAQQALTRLLDQKAEALVEAPQDSGSTDPRAV